MRVTWKKLTANNLVSEDTKTETVGDSEGELFRGLSKYIATVKIP